MVAEAIAGFEPPAADGIWQGWSMWASHDPFECHAGPFYARREADGSMIAGFRPGDQNMNGGGALHGGSLMTFADYALFIIGHDSIAGRHGVTVSFTSEFIGPAVAGQLLIARGEILRTGRNLIFVRGVIDAEGDAVLNFSGIIKVSNTPR